jgi:glucosamine--fructose-6-phosphate aminotransferase (isomerizing)
VSHTQIDVANAGLHAREEILSQPVCWTKCIEQLPGLLSASGIAEMFEKTREWLFVGCGSSYYVALAAAAAWSSTKLVRARAVPASEILLFPELTIPRDTAVAAVAISRSGQTSEVVRATEFLERQAGIPTLAISCAKDAPLARTASRKLLLLDADEESTVMTRSFTSMLIGLQYAAAFLTHKDDLAAGLSRMPAQLEPGIRPLSLRIRDFVAAHQFADYVCLGQGPLYGLACECALKLSEMSISYAQSYHTLEFRHGPKSVVAPQTLVVFLISESSYDAECDVLQETKQQGGTTLAVVNRADERVRASADFLIELQTDVPEFARVAPYAFAGQLLGLYTGLKKGFDPDHPRNLSRVVMLEGAR